MSTIINMISKKLGIRNLIPLENDRLIKDASNVIELKRCFESSGLIRVLENLGWEERLLNYPLLELICLYLEDHNVSTGMEKAYDRLKR